MRPVDCNQLQRRLVFLIICSLTIRADDDDDVDAEGGLGTALDQ